jgi:uncharacterized protein YjgD (DUF1641 family)
MSDLTPSSPSGGTQLDRVEAKLDRLQLTLDRFGPALDQLGAVDGLLATLGNSFDDLAARDGNASFDARVRRAVAVLVRLADPQLLTALERLLDPRTITLLADAAAELPNAAAAPSEDHGPLGLVAVLREDEVRRATGFLVHFARRLGRVLEDREVLA